MGRKTLLTELQREGITAWYRNLARSSQDSLGVVYEDGNEKRIVRPDLVFFGKVNDGAIAADIVVPHGHHLADALQKFKGLAQHAKTYSTVYRGKKL